MALTRTESIDENLAVAQEPDSAYEAIRAAFEAVGRIKTEDPSFRRVVGKIYSGGAGMNAATVTVSVSEVAVGGSELRINANAQEGLIKQHTAPRAISRLLDAYKQCSNLLKTPADVTEGWKPDPSGRYPDRYWDGFKWTEWTRDKPGGTRFEDPPVAQESTGGKPTDERARVSLADELRKLVELRESGDLTSDEFAALKAQLLTGSGS